MSGYNNGYFDASMRARAADADANVAIESWMNHAARLEAQIESLKFQLAQKTATSSANNDMVKELRQRLAAVAPNEPLASPEAATERLQDLIRARADALGYRVIDRDQLAPK